MRAGLPYRIIGLPPFAVSNTTKLLQAGEILIRSTDIFLIESKLDSQTLTCLGTEAKIIDNTPIFLRVPLVAKSGTLKLPHIFESQEYSLLRSLKAIFEYDWHYHILFHDLWLIREDPPSQESDLLYNVIPADAMLYIFVNSLWDLNLRKLDSSIQNVSFRDLRDPRPETNVKLHDYRETLEYLHNATHEAIKAAPSTPSLVEFFEKLKTDFKKGGIHVYNPVKFLETTHKEAGDAQKFLMETFQLLMSSMSVRESRIAGEQASQTTVLTYLAILYLPMTVATGVFGMNISEINGGVPKFWWVIVVMLILVFFTVAQYVVIYMMLEGPENLKTQWKRLTGTEKKREERDGNEQRIGTMPTNVHRQLELPPATGSQTQRQGFTNDINGKRTEGVGPHPQNGQAVHSRQSKKEHRKIVDEEAIANG